jgi:heat shock protein HslJ
MAVRRAVSVISAALVALTVGLATPAHAGDAGPTAPSASAKVDVVGTWYTSRVKVPQSVTFVADGTVHGAAGCNSFSGTYKIKGSAITVGPLATTLKLCEDPVMYAEQMFLAKLQSANTAVRDCGNLTLSTDAGRLRLNSSKPGQPVVACSTNARP